MFQVITVRANISNSRGSFLTLISWLHCKHNILTLSPECNQVKKCVFVIQSKTGELWKICLTSLQLTHCKVPLVDVSIYNNVFQCFMLLQICFLLFWINVKSPVFCYLPFVSLIEKVHRKFVEFFLKLITLNNTLKLLCKQWFEHNTISQYF